MLKRCRFIYFQGNKLIRNFSKCNVYTKIRLFKAYCSTIYTSHLWFRYKQATHKKITVAYNCIFRILLNIPRFEDGQSYSASGMFARNNVKNFTALVRHSIFNFIDRLSTSCNNVINHLVSGTQTTVIFTSSIWAHWRHLLYTYL